LSDAPAPAADLTTADLTKVYAAPTPRVLAKQRPTLDAHSIRFIGLSPFCVLATGGPNGEVDASPRGGGPGFVQVGGTDELLMPDRPGNNRIDSFRNILAGSGFVQLLFFVPGIDETLRVGGQASVTTDPALLSRLEEFGKPPRAVLRVKVTEAYFHCGKALMRSQLWSPAVQVERKAFPSISQVIHDQTTLGDPETQAEVEARYRTQL
jgi:PPOX class probable FMN-dependent enzyme